MNRKPKPELTWRQRRFVQLIAAGGRTQPQCYLAAGYTWNGTDRTLRKRASEVRHLPTVTREIRRLTKAIEAAMIAAAAARQSPTGPKIAKFEIPPSRPHPPAPARAASGGEKRRSFNWIPGDAEAEP